MIEAKIPENEAERLSDLLNLEILDTPQEESFTEIVELASWICKTPISTISLIDNSRQWFKAKVGIDATETSKDVAFCSHTILEKDHLIINDATMDKRFSGNPFVTGTPDIRFYAGIPLISENGNNIGSLCVIDTVPRDLSEDQLKALKTLSRQAMNLIRLRRYNKLLKKESVLVKEDNKVLAKLNDIKDKLFTVVSHDIRSPLATIENTLQLFMEGLFTKEELDIIIGELYIKVKDTTQFVDNLLFWSKSQFDGIKARPVRTDVKEIVDETVRLLSSNAKNKEIILKNDLPEDLFVFADTDMIKIILRNLISNAIKFCSFNDIISIGLEYRDEKNMIFFVADTGTGMPEEICKDMFRKNMFYSSVGTNNETGTGVGLILCRDLLAKNKGDMWVKSEEGKGSTFYFKLPIAE